MVHASVAVVAALRTGLLARAEDRGLGVMSLEGYVFWTRYES